MKKQLSYHWLDGKVVTYKNFSIPVLTHSLHYGSAVFEGIRFYQKVDGSVIFRLEDHLNRLKFSARAIGVKIKYSKTVLSKAIVALIKKNRTTEGYIRPIVWVNGNMKINVFRDTHVGVSIWPWPRVLGHSPVKVKISNIRRIHPKTTVVEAKIAGHYINSIQAIKETDKSSYDEALLLDTDGYVAEGPVANIFFVKNRKLITPARGSILSGITRDTIIHLAKDLRLTIVERRIKPKEIKSFDEAFFTGTAIEILPIAKIDNYVFNKSLEGPVTKSIKKAYNDIVRGNIKKYSRKWITRV